MDAFKKVLGGDKQNAGNANANPAVASGQKADYGDKGKSTSIRLLLLYHSSIGIGMARNNKTDKLTNPYVQAPSTSTRSTLATRPTTTS